MKKFVGIVLAVAFLLRALPALATSTGWLLPNAALPTSASCLALAINSTYAAQTEGVATNTPFNTALTLPTPNQLSVFYANPNADDNLLAPVGAYSSITGNFPNIYGATPTTDQINVYYSCMEGVDSDTIKAEEMAESGWDQRTFGDEQTNKAACTQSNGAAPLWNGANCYTSFGILQDKTGGPGQWTAYPYNKDSTNFELDLRTALLRSCINGGQQAFFDHNGTGGPNSPYNSYRTDVSSCVSSNSVSSSACVELFTGCVATHFSGAWWDGSNLGSCNGSGGAQNYWTNCVLPHLTAHDWPGGVN